MQIVIDDEKIIDLLETEWGYEGIREDIARVIRENGTPLPKGHGDLIERDKLEYLKAIHDAKYGHISWIDAIEKIKHSAPTIIETDKAERSEE